jgi:hypothetical protein
MIEETAMEDVRRVTQDSGLAGAPTSCCAPLRRRDPLLAAGVRRLVAGERATKDVGAVTQTVLELIEERD